jgi:hypothetical protein
MCIERKPSLLDRMFATVIMSHIGRQIGLREAAEMQRQSKLRSDMEYAEFLRGRQ